MLPSHFKYCLCLSDDSQSSSDAQNKLCNLLQPNCSPTIFTTTNYSRRWLLKTRIPAQDAMGIEPRRSLRLHPMPSLPLNPATPPKKRQYIEISSIECSPINKPPARTQRNTDVSPISVKEKATRSKKKDGTKKSSPVKAFMDVAVGPDEVCSPNDTLYEGIQMIKDAFGTDLTCSLCCKTYSHKSDSLWISYWIRLFVGPVIIAIANIVVWHVSVLYNA